MPPLPLDPKTAARAMKAADQTVNLAAKWTFKQTAEVVIPFVTLVLCAVYIGYQVGWAEPGRMEFINQMRKDDNASDEKVAETFAATLTNAIAHGEKQSEKREQLWRDLIDNKLNKKVARTEEEPLAPAPN